MSEPIRQGEFWRGPAEAATYLEAVTQNPKGEDESTWAYIVRLSELVTGEEAAYQEQMRKASL